VEEGDELILKVGGDGTFITKKRQPSGKSASTIV